MSRPALPRALPWLLLAGVTAGWIGDRLDLFPSFSRSRSVEEAIVKRVLDGDTVILSTGERVRYLGIDTPERGKPWASEATAFNRSLVEGRGVRLESDAELRDQYGRLLAYVYVDEEMVNVALLREGLARLLIYPPNTRYEAWFRALEAEARAAERGLWRRGGARPVPSDSE